VLTGEGEFMVFSGSVTDMEWTKSGSLTLSRSDGFAFCYSGSVDTIPLSGCARENVTLALVNATGTLELRSLG
jgi:hypothetical protein